MCAGVIICLLIMAGQLTCIQMEEVGALSTVTGVVEQVSKYKNPPIPIIVPTSVRVVIRSSKGDDCDYYIHECEYMQDYEITNIAPQLLALQHGDRVTAKYYKLRSRGVEKILWTLQRDGYDVLSDSDTVKYYEDRKHALSKRYPLVLILFLAAVLLRILSEGSRETKV